VAKKSRHANDLMDALDPCNFIFHAADENGHGTTLRVRLSPSMMYELQVMIARQVGPYRTREDIVRDALYHRVAWIHANKEQVAELGDTQRRIAAMHMQVEYARQMAEFGKALDEMDKVLREIPTMDKREVVVNNVWQQVLQVEDDSWREVFAEKVRHNYSNYLWPFDMGRRSNS